MSGESPHSVTAVVLAAGLSTRMGGQLKPLLPWGNRTVIDHIVRVLSGGSIDGIIVVTGHQSHALQQHLRSLPVRAVFNPAYASGEMLSSIQVGLESAAMQADAALIVLGDQPALSDAVVQSVIAAYGAGQGTVIIPSYQMRRGHPLLIDRKHWQTILQLQPGQSLRDFMSSAGSDIHHVSVNTPSILRDMDTPDEYRRELAAYLSQPSAHLA